MREEPLSGICDISIEAEELPAASSLKIFDMRHQTVPQRFEVNTEETKVDTMDDESVVAGNEIERVIKCCRWTRPPDARKLARDSCDEIVSK